MTQQTFIVDYGLTITGGNSISSDTGVTTITGLDGVELLYTGVDAGATVGVEDTIASFMLAGNATAASNIVVSLDQVSVRTTGNVQLAVGDNTWTFDTALLDPTESYLYVPGGAAITTPNATGGAGGKNIFIEAGSADQSNFYTTAGGELFLKGGRGAFNDGGGGGKGGNVNINAGESADPAGVAGNVYITAGALKNWTFDNTGNLNAPNNITTDGNIVANIIGASTQVQGRTLATDTLGFVDLPSPQFGIRAFVNDANLVAAGNFGAQVSGGGSNVVPIWGDGSVWRIG